MKNTATLALRASAHLPRAQVPGSVTKDQDPLDLIQLNDIMRQAGQAANQKAERAIFAMRATGKSPQPLRRNRADIAVFENYQQSVGVSAVELYGNPQAWCGVTWALVEGFNAWQLGQGYAIGRINIRLSTVRMFAELAAKTGAITAQESILIASVKGYAPHEGKHVDETRKAEGMDTRRGTTNRSLTN